MYTYLYIYIPVFVQPTPACINVVYKYSHAHIQEAMFNVGVRVSLITLAHLSYFPTNKCKAAIHKNVNNICNFKALKYIKYE